MLRDLATHIRIQFYVSSRVYQEQIASSLSLILEEWSQVGILKVERISPQALAACGKIIQKKRVRPLPGRNDQTLITLARQLDAPLFTHDGPAAGAARALGCLVVDLVDMVDLYTSVRELELRQSDPIFNAWNYRGVWRPDDWKGSLEATVMGRPFRGEVQERLREHLLPNLTPDSAP